MTRQAAAARFGFRVAALVCMAPAGNLLAQSTAAGGQPHDSTLASHTRSAAPAAPRPAAAPDHDRLEQLRRTVVQAESGLAAGAAAAAITAFERASAELGTALLYGEPRGESDVAGDLARRIAAGSARAHLQLGEPFLARVEARRALNIDPGDAALQALLGASCYRLARFAEADSAFAEALRLDPSSAAAHGGRALLDLTYNHLASAREGFQRAYRLDKNPERLWYLARIAFLERDYGEAADRLREYLDRVPDLPQPRSDELRERARIYDGLRDGKGSRLASRVTRGQLRFDVARGDEVPLLPVRLNGRDPVYLLFDTGAQDHVLDAAYARELGLRLSPPAGRVENAFGAAERRLAVVDSLDLNGILVRDVPVSVADFGALGLGGRGTYYVAGVLSPSLLLRDFLVRIDFFHRTIDLQRYDAGGAEYLERSPSLRRRSVPFAFNADGTGMIVQGELAGSPGHPLLLDTGASDVYLSATLGRVLDLDPLNLRVGLGDYRKERLRAHFLRDLGTVEEDGSGPGVGVAYDGILGYPFFRDMRLVFDYYHSLLLIEN